MVSPAWAERANVMKVGATTPQASAIRPILPRKPRRSRSPLPWRSRSCLYRRSRSMVPLRPAVGFSVCCRLRGPLRVDALVVLVEVFATDERRLVGRGLVDDRPDRRVIVRVGEEGDRIAILAVAIDHPMLGRREAAVAPALQDVADIDDERAVDRRHADPLAALVLDLEAAEIVLPENREAAAVAMTADPDHLGVAGDLLGRVVVELQDQHRIDIRGGEARSRA